MSFGRRIGLHDGPWVWAAALAAVCLFTAAGAAWLALAGARWPGLALWMLVGAAISFALAWQALARWAAYADIRRLADRVLSALDDQGSTLEEQHRLLAQLGAAFADEPMRRDLKAELRGMMRPNLLALLGQLQAAEQVVPDGAVMTRSWLQRAFHLADNTRARLERVEEELDGR